MGYVIDKKTVRAQQLTMVIRRFIFYGPLKGGGIIRIY